MILPLLGLVGEIEEPWPNIFGATLVLLVLTSTLPPILRKMQPAAAPRSANGRVDGGMEFLAVAVIEIADRIAVLNSDPGNREPEIRAQVNRLRELARTYEN